MAPEADGGLELPLRLQAGAGTRPDIGAHPVEGEHRGLALQQLEVRRHVHAVGLDRHGGGQRHGQRGGAEHRVAAPELHGVRLGPVTEARGDLRPERERPADTDDPPDQPVAVRLAGLVDDGHEVLDLRDPVRGEEPCDQDVGVGEVELPGTGRHVRGQFEAAAPVGVEYRREHAGCIETRAAVPVDGAVGGDERGGTEITDQAVLGDRQIPGTAQLPESAPAVLRHGGLLTRWCGASIRTSCFMLNRSILECRSEPVCAVGEQGQEQDPGGEGERHQVGRADGARAGGRRGRGDC